METSCDDATWSVSAEVSANAYKAETDGVVVGVGGAHCILPNVLYCCRKLFTVIDYIQELHWPLLNFGKH